MIKSISIIFPLYNEEKRLLQFISNLKKLIKQLKKKNFEIIIVNDGSNDKSEYLIKKYLKNFKQKNIKYISYKKNKGKGYALKVGVEKAKKKWILTCDMDFSTSPIEVLKWEKKYIKKKETVYFGSRLNSLSKVEHRFYRFFMGYFFQFIVSLLFNTKITDTQCGFKLYPSNIGKFVFKKLTSYGYTHDVEIILILRKKLVEIVELPITWIHRDLGKINLLIDIPQMFFSLLLLRRIYKKL